MSTAVDRTCPPHLNRQSQVTESKSLVRGQQLPAVARELQLIRVHSMSNPARLRRSVPYIAAAVCSFLYFWPFLRVLSHSGDEGTLIMGAVRVAQGQLPFRDFFEVMGPGTFYWLAIFFKLLGTTWLATRVDLLFTTTLTLLVLLYLARRLQTGLEIAPLVFFVAVSFHSWNVVSHHLDSNLFGLAAFAAFVCWMDSPRPLTLFLAGSASALTMFFMLPKGLYLFLALVLTLWLYRKEHPFSRACAVLLGGFALTTGLVGVWFWGNGGLHDLIYANLLWPLHHYSSINEVPYGWEFRQIYWSAFTSSLESAFSPRVGLALSSVLSIPFVVVMALPLVLALCLARFRREAFDRLTVPYWIAGTAFWFSEMHRKDINHIVYGAPLFILLAFFYCRRITAAWVKAALRIVTACAVMLALLNPLIAHSSRYRHETRRGLVYDSFRSTDVLDYLNANVANNSPVFVYPYSPMFYFLSGAQNPTRYSLLMYNMNTDQQFREVVESLETAKVRYVVWDRSFPRWINDWFPAYRIPPSDQQIIEPYLVEHYRVVGRSPDGFEFLERKETLQVRK